MKFCVIGLGHFGYYVATTLADNGMEVLAIDEQESTINAIRDKVTHAINMRINNEEGLRTIGVEDMDVVIVAMGEHFDQSILITALLKQRLKIKKVIVRSISRIHKEILELIGADEVLLLERQSGIQLADRLSLNFETLARITHNFSISQMPAPQEFIGKTLSQINLQQNYSVECIGIKSSQDINNNIELVDYKLTKIKNSDILILAGKNEDLTNINRLK